MISPNVKKYAILMLATMGSKLGHEKFSIAMLCLMAIGLTAAEINDAIMHPYHPDEDSNPFLEMFSHAAKDPDIIAIGIDMKDTPKPGDLN